MSKQNDVKYLSGDQYISLLAQGRITTKRPKNAQELEADRLMQECIQAAERGEKFC